MNSPAPLPFVLVIGNTPTSRKIIEVSLRRKGCLVQSYEYPSEEYRALHSGNSSRRTKISQVIFVDLTLPEVNTIIKDLRAYRCIKIVGIAPRNSLFMRLKAWHYGVYYLPKPFTERQLADLVLSSGHAVNPDETTI